MQIQLKQTEIIAALKQYIAAQGISLTGKSVEITFTASRGAAGIVADLSIEETSIPGFTDAPAEDAPAAPQLTVVASNPAPEAKAAESVDAAEEAPVGEKAPAKTPGLFN